MSINSGEGQIKIYTTCQYLYSTITEKLAVAWADRIYHMAAVVGVKKVLEDPVAVMATNMTGTERILRAIQHGGWNPQVIIASTSEVYGFNSKSSFPETDHIALRSAGRLRWAYAVTKLADEFLAFSYARIYDLHIVVVRLFNTIGPNQVGHYGMVVPSFTKQAVRNAPLTVYGEGSQTRSFCDVRDTVVALDRLAGCQEAWGEVVNVGNDQENIDTRPGRVDRATRAQPLADPLDDAPLCGSVVKKAFWLNPGFVQRIVAENDGLKGVR